MAKRKQKSKRRASASLHQLSDDQFLAQAESDFQEGRIAQASLCYERFVARSIDRPEHILRVAMNAHQHQRHEQAILLLEHLRERQPRNVIMLSLLAWCHWLRGRAREALALALQVIEIAPEMTGAHGLASQCYQRLQRHDEERAILQQALAQSPGDPEAVIMLADCLARDGEHERAERDFVTTLARPDLPIALQVKGWNRLGFLYDRIGEYARAYEAFERCGHATSRMPEARERDHTVVFRYIASYRQAATPEFFEHCRIHHQPETTGSNAEPRSPAFLVGFPRSGTTMLEQVLASHPDIVTTDEEPALERTGQAALKQLSASNPGAMLRAMTPEAARASRAFYRQQIRRVNERAFEPGTLLVDKLPLNLIHIGVMNAIFPDARILVALRDPRDVCLSCFMQDFNINEAMIQFLSMESTVRFYEAVMDWYQHVKPMLSMPIIEARYEDTVADLESQSKRVLSSLGVPWHTDVLAFHRRGTDHRITTPSLQAVQQPVYTRAVRRWERYADSLPSSVSRLNRFAEAFGYDPS